MATLLKIRGLDRVSSSQSLLTGEGRPARGFRVPSALSYFPSGVAALNRVGVVGTPNAAVRYDAKYPGAWANAVTGGTTGLNVKQNTPSGSSTVIAVTYPNTGLAAPLISITPSTTDTAATLVAAVNAHPEASQYVVASLVGTGASAPVASANASAVYTITANASVSAGTFTITIPGFGTTTAIPWNETAANVAAAVQVAIRLNPANASATVTGGTGPLPSANVTLTLGGTGGASLPFPDATINGAGLTGGTFPIALTTWGQSANGAMNGGLSSGTGQTMALEVSGRRTAVVDVDDPKTARILRKYRQRFVELGAQ